ncbi:helix-turn-helix domain-containing protein [Candidatus Woesearchaeota archaeon]|nr:helix-turn-helix domain-containing protein [Candidatus Woesearchaeota archaeon]
MQKNNFLLVDLNEPKTKKLAETITSETSRKILNVLAENDATESTIATDLKIPLPTVHYHLQKLQEAGLVTVEEFHYSSKGREVNHYKLANKYIIIAPRKVSGLKQKLRGILPVGLLILGLSALWGLFSKTVISKQSAKVMPGFPAMEQNVFVVPPPTYADQYSILWFLLGSVVTLLLYVIIVIVQERIVRR